MSLYIYTHILYTHTFNKTTAIRMHSKCIIYIYIHSVMESNYYASLS